MRMDEEDRIPLNIPGRRFVRWKEVHSDVYSRQTSRLGFIKNMFEDYSDATKVSRKRPPQLEKQ